MARVQAHSDTPGQRPGERLARHRVLVGEPGSAQLPPSERLLAYARFFATRRSIEADPPALVPLESFSDAELRAYEELEAELTGLREEARKPTLRPEVAVRRSWHFADPGPLTIVCAQLPPENTGSFANPADPNYTELQSFADLDALIELHGHVRAENPAMEVFCKAAPKVVPDDLSGHVVLLGGIVWNEVTKSLYDLAELPIEQVVDPEIKTGEIFVVDDGANKKKFLPKWSDSSRKVLMEDVGLLVRVPNPLIPAALSLFVTACTAVAFWARYAPSLTRDYVIRTSSISLGISQLQARTPL